MSMYSNGKDKENGLSGDCFTLLTMQTYTMMVMVMVIFVDLPQAVMAGDYILSVASTILARIRNEEVIVVLSQVSHCLDPVLCGVGQPVLICYFLCGDAR